MPVSVLVRSAVHDILMLLGVISTLLIVGAAIAPGTVGVSNVRVLDHAPTSYPLTAANWKS